MCHDAVIDLYERHAHDFDRDRRAAPFREQVWLDRFLGEVAAGGAVLDVGCGTAEPIARYIIARGFHVTGVDASNSMIALCRARLPDHEWVVSDMRVLALASRFDGIIAWDSFFHLTMDEQRAMFARFAAHAAPGAALMFTSGPRAGEAIGSYRGEPLYHASLDPAEYQQLLASHGFTLRTWQPEDPECGGHTVWLAFKSSSPRTVTRQSPRRPPSSRRRRTGARSASRRNGRARHPGSDR